MQRTMIPMVGESHQNNSLRFHVYMSSVEVLNLKNAGKRGKVVDGFVLYNIDFVRDSKTFDMLYTFIKSLQEWTYEQAEHEAKSIITQRDSDQMQNPKMEIRQRRGLDVAPKDFESIIIDSDHVTFEAAYDTFTINDKRDEYNLPSCIPGRSKKCVKQVYQWAQANLSRLPEMTFREIMSELTDNHIDYHYYCRMD